MPEASLLAEAESALAQVWGGAVKLAIEQSWEDHPHVSRVTVQSAPAAAPATVILKRARDVERDQLVPGFSAQRLMIEWANNRFLAAKLGDEVLLPRIYAADAHRGYLIMEDLGTTEPLNDALWGKNPQAAAQVMVRYGALLGRLHGKTAGQRDEFIHMQRQLNPNYLHPVENYWDILQPALETLKRAGIDLPTGAVKDVRAAADKLTDPGDFSSFIHGDPVHSNILEQAGRWGIIDLEGGVFRHALIEGAYPRLVFPTTGLMYMQRLPDAVWRQSEAAYRAGLQPYIPAAADDAIFGAHMTAACAFWALVFCRRWLERALAGADPEDRTLHLRRCVLLRCEQFCLTAHEFGQLPHLEKVFAALVTRLHSQWPEETYTMPLYPSFQAA